MADRRVDILWARNIEKNTEGLRDLNKVVKDNKDSVVNLTDTFLSNVNVVQKLTQVIKTSEKLQLQSLAIGTTYSKFVSMNTKALAENNSTQQEMTQALLTGWNQGLRGTSDGLNNLIDDMIVTGQKTDTLTQAMAANNLLTGFSQEAQEELAGTITKTSKTYGVASERLAESLDGLQSQLVDFSIYGTDAVESLGNIYTEMVGIAGGSDIAKEQLKVILGMGDALNVSQQSLLGIRDTMTNIRQGNITAQEAMDQLVDAGNRLIKKTAGSDEIKQSFAEVAGRQQTAALISIAKLGDKNFALAKEQQATEQEKLDTLAQRQREVDRYYQTLAPQMHNVIVRYLPALVGAGLLGRFGMQTGKMVKADTRFGNIYTVGHMMGSSKNRALMQAANMAGGPAIFRGAGLIGKSARLLGLLGGPIGIGITALSFIPDLLGLFKENTKASKETAKTLKEMKARSENAGVADRGIAMAAKIASETVRGSLDPKTQDQMLVELRKLVAISRANASNGVKKAEVR